MKQSFHLAWLLAACACLVGGQPTLSDPVILPGDSEIAAARGSAGHGAASDPA